MEIISAKILSNSGLQWHGSDTFIREDDGNNKTIKVSKIANNSMKFIPYEHFSLISERYKMGIKRGLTEATDMVADGKFARKETQYIVPVASILVLRQNSRGKTGSREVINSRLRTSVSSSVP
jgi:hypothetical protein